MKQTSGSKSHFSISVFSITNQITALYKEDHCLEIIPSLTSINVNNTEILTAMPNETVSITGLEGGETSF